MNTIRCPMCNEPVPEPAQYCAGCGGSMTSPGHNKSVHYRIDQAQARQLETERPPQVGASERAVTLKLSQFDPLSDDKDTIPSENILRPAVVTSSPRARSGSQTTPLQKEQRSSRRRGLDADREEIKRPPTWHKDVALSPNRAKAAPPPPRPVPSRVPMLNTWRARYRLHQLPPTTFLWVSLLILILAIFGSIFGVVVTLSRGVENKTRHNGELSLQVNPNSVAVGATVMLSGTNFSPHGHIGLSRDASIPIIDTSNTSIIEADGSGNFSDTIAISPDWESGPHTINAEDAVRHKVASFSIIVTGHAGSLRPAHLRVSTDALDLGTGDQVTNTTKTITLTNVGGGQISWQSNSNQPWLVLSPSSGTFASGHSAQVIAAINRSKLDLGSYNAQISIQSNAGSSTLPVKAEVTTLLPEHAAMLQLTPALLSFTAADGNVSPSTQTVTISNPGLQQLQWQATSNADWLSASPQSAAVEPSGSMPVTINVNTSNLLPGTYNGVVMFGAQGSAFVRGDPQTLQVTVTVLPQCSLQVSPGMLSFASVYQQSLPAPKVITIGTSQSCGTHIAWQAVSSANWLTIDATSGNTPSTPAIGINVSNLTPGTYTSSIIFSSVAGSVSVPVTFTLGPAAIPLVATAPAVMVFNGISGQSDPSPQQISIANNGSSGAFTWNAQASTAVGGNWLSVSPASGSLTAHQSAVLSITTTILPGLVPGTYKGTITITGVDSAGHPALGSPQTIPVSLLVKPGCAIAVTPAALNFSGIAGQPISTQQVAILASTSCTHMLNWTATVASDGNWLTATTTGTTAAGNAGIINVGVTSINSLRAGNHVGTITITAIDSVTQQAVSPPQTVTVGLTVQQPTSIVTPTPTPSPSSTPSPSPTPTSAPTPTPTSASTPAPTPTPAPTSTPISTLTAKK